MHKLAGQYLSLQLHHLSFITSASSLTKCILGGNGRFYANEVVMEGLLIHDSAYVRNHVLTSFCGSDVMMDWL